MNKIVDIALNGKEAVESINAAIRLGLSHKLVLTDFSMPVMDGLEATRQIKQIYRTNRTKINIVGITGHSEEAFRQKALAQGMDYVESKPISKEHLMQVLK